MSSQVISPISSTDGWRLLGQLGQSDMADEVMSASEVAAALHVSRQAIDRYICEGKLQARMRKVGQRGTYQIRRSDFVAFVRRYVRDDWS